MNKNKIILYGPPVGKDIKAGYGGGTGGYTRNMAAYLNFDFTDFELIPLFHTVRGEINFGKLTFVIRFLIDLIRIIKCFLSIKPNSIHILAQYRTATVREFTLAFISNSLGMPYLYEIKAGAFINFYKNTNFINKYFINYIVKNSKIILCEGEIYIDFIEQEFKRKSYYLPNFVLSKELPEKENTLFNNEFLNIVFVGYCTRAKGVFELLDAVVKITNETNIQIKLTLIGSEEKEFKKYINNISVNKNLIINRKGVLAHKDVLQELSKNDIYCYPTDHDGEGHNNSINEAMIFGLVIITTRKGFLGQVLHEDSAYFLDSIDSSEIAKNIKDIYLNKKLAKEKAMKARKKLLDNYVDTVVYDDFVKHYKKLNKKENKE